MGFDIDSQTFYGDADGLRNFFLTHSIAHRLYAIAAVGRFNTSLPSLNLYDTSALDSWIQCMHDGANVTQALRAWLEAHNNLHQSELQLVNQSGLYDFSVLNPQSEEQFYDWMQTHQAIHDYEAIAFGVQI